MPIWVQVDCVLQLILICALTHTHNLAKHPQHVLIEVIYETHITGIIFNIGKQISPNHRSMHNFLTYKKTI